MLKKFVCFLLVTTLIPSLSFSAQNNTFSLKNKKQSSTPTVRHISPDEVREFYDRALEKAKTFDPDLYQKIIASSNSIQKVTATSDTVGDTLSFWANNFETNTPYQTSAICKAMGNYTRIWVEIASIDSGFVTQDVVDSILTNLEDHTDPTSIDPGRGIYDIDTDYFGNPSDVDSDGYVDFLILDIKDGFSGEGSYYAGYFTNSNLSGYNNRDMLYLDSYPAIYNKNTQTHNTYQVLSTTSHEFQHLIHYNYDPDEEPWLNESMSELAGTLCGYGLDSPELFLSNPNSSIDVWNNEYFDYTKVNLWALYMYEQFGINFVKDLVQDTDNSTVSVDNALSGLYSSFDDSYENWILCNYINNRNVDTEWGYLHPDVQGMRASATTANEFPVAYSNQIKIYGALYYKFNFGSNLIVTFDGTTSFAKLIRKGSLSVDVIDLADSVPYNDTEFGTTYSEDIIVVGSKSSTENFTINANATQDMVIELLTHDDGTPDAFNGDASYLGTGDTTLNYGWAVQYFMPANDSNTFLSMEIDAIVGSGGDVDIHIWEDDQNSPGNDLFTSEAATIVGGVNEIDITSLFGDISLPESFFIGFTHTSLTSAVYVGMDNTESTNYTWLIRPPADGGNAALNTLNHKCPVKY